MVTQAEVWLAVVSVLLTAGLWVLAYWLFGWPGFAIAALGGFSMTVMLR